MSKESPDIGRERETRAKGPSLQKEIQRERERGPSLHKEMQKRPREIDLFKAK